MHDSAIFRAVGQHPEPVFSNEPATHDSAKYAAAKSEQFGQA